MGQYLPRQGTLSPRVPGRFPEVITGRVTVFLRLPSPPPHRVHCPHQLCGPPTPYFRIGFPGNPNLLRGHHEGRVCIGLASGGPCCPSSAWLGISCLLGGAPKDHRENQTSNSRSFGAQPTNNRCFLARFSQNMPIGFLSFFLFLIAVWDGCLPRYPRWFQIYDSPVSAFWVLSLHALAT